MVRGDLGEHASTTYAGIVSEKASNNVSKTILFVFVLLQIFDLASTMIFLDLGVGEANHLIVALMNVVNAPLYAVVSAKVIAIALCIFCWMNGRRRLLLLVNRGYAALIVWNMSAIGIALAARH